MDFFHKPPVVLLSHINNVSRGKLTQSLQAGGFEVIVADTSEQCLARLKECEVDVLLWDVTEDYDSGLGMLHNLRRLHRFRLLPMVFMSNDHTMDAMENALLSGGDDYLKKPVDDRELIARIGAAALRKKTSERLDDTENILFTLARIVEARDLCTGDHCDRLAHMAARLGEDFGLGEADLDTLRRAAVLHDIGKIGIPDRILMKAGPLNEDERTLMKKHVAFGKALLEPLPSMRETLQIVENHHEKWNGSGYPRGLSGESIPRLARIFQLVDVFDALTSRRPYKDSMSFEQAIEVMKDETRKGYWDPSIFMTFARLIKQTPQDFTFTMGGKDRSLARHIFEEGYGLDVPF